MKALALIAVAALLALTPSRVDAGYHHVVLGSGKTVSTIFGRGGSSNRFICWANPAGILICVAIGAIIVDEVRRTIEGPVCATNRMTRRSYFGMVWDEPKLWRKLCNWKGAVVVTTLARPKKLWKYGK